MPNLRFGKHPPQRDYRTLNLKKYVSTLAPPPESVDVLQRINKNLNTSDIAALFPIDGNDTLGDCTIAAMAHATTVFQALTDKRQVPSAQSVIKLYRSLTGGPDTGLVELNVLNHWRHNKDLGESILAFVSIDPKNRDHVKQAVQLFGGAYIGFQVQEACLDDFNAHRPWTPGPLTSEGHAVFVVGYDSAGVNVLTWGSTQRGTWDWFAECVDEAYAILPVQAADPRFAPGFDISQLKADLAAVAR